MDGQLQKPSKRTLRIVANTVGLLLVVFAIVVLLTTFLFPTLRIYGTSMDPTLQEGNVVVSVKGSDYRQGDIVAFYYNNKIMVKRVICGPGDWFDMKEDGTVYVNNERIDEKYVLEPSFQRCDIELPYQVPDGSYFVMGDQRTTSIDLRVAQIGCIPADLIVGKVFLRVWPLNTIGVVG